MAALNALADYSSENSDENSSDSSSESDETDGEEQENDRKIDVEDEKLPLPDILNENPQKSRSESSSLKMDDNSASSSVFFNPFKAKEDEKLAILERHVKLTERKDDTKGGKAKFRRNKNAQKAQNRQHFHGQNQRNDSDDGFKTFQKRKRRVGVNDSLIPPKKALQAYEKQRREEKPRT